MGKCGPLKWLCFAIAFFSGIEIGIFLLDDPYTDCMSTGSVGRTRAPALRICIPARISSEQTGPETVVDI